MRWITGVLVVLLVILAGLAIHGYRVIHQPVLMEPPSLPLTVATGESLRVVLRRLERDGAIVHARRVEWVMRALGREVGIRAGEYEIPAGTDVSGLVEHLVAGRTVLHSLTIVEGWTFRQLRRAVAANPALVQTLEGVDEGVIMDRLGRPGMYPEGLFFPDTYLFPRGTTDLAFLERAMRTMDARLARAWEGRDGGLPYDRPYDALIMASLIEREARIPEERGTIAGVFVRRLRLGMRLQTDPTVMYGVSPDFTGRLRTHHLRTDTPYNTYTRHGLPPTPIAMPGAGALTAAMHPEHGEVLYFVARGDGSHHFSVTLEEHNRAVARYQLGVQDDGSRTER